MGIIVKHILKSILEKKLRTVLILFSVAVSSALIFASSAISGSLVSMFNERMKQYYGTSDFVIYGDGRTNPRNFSTENAKPFMESLEYIVGGFQGYAEYRNEDGKKYNISLIGMEQLKDDPVNPVYIDEESGLYPFDGRKIIVNRPTAARFGWKLGDIVELRLGSRQKFIVSGIAAPTGFLFDDGESNCIIVPKNTLTAIYGMRGRDNVLYVKLKNSEEKRSMLDKFQSVYKGCGFGWFSMTTDMDVPLKLLTLVISFMSLFIIYTTFKVITLERLPVIGTFRSMGATRRTTRFIMLVESALYGITGGIFGCAMGIGLLYIMAGITKNSWTRIMDTSIRYTPLQLVMAFISAVALCLVSSIAPILKTSNISIKEIILNAIDKQYKRGGWKAILGVGMMVAAVAVPLTISDRFPLVLAVDMACLIMFSVASVLLVPFLTGIIVKMIEAVYRLIFGNIGILAAKNLRENKSILNSISLLSIGIATLLLVMTATDSMNKDVLNNFDSNYNFSVIVRYQRADKGLEQLVRAIDGVSGANGLYSARNIGVKSLNENITQMDGIGSMEYFDYWKLDPGDGAATVIESLDSGRKIMLSNSLNFVLGVKKGDYITLQMPKGDRVYQVIGFYDTTLYGGNHALVSERYLKLDTGRRYFSSINIKTAGEASGVADNIIKGIRRDGLTVDTVEDMKKRNMDGNKQITGILTGFAVLSLLIGIIGVFNNLLISFIERRHSLAVLKSIGMSRLQTVKMILVESLTGGLIGGIAGVSTGCLQLLLVPKIMRATGQYIPVHYNFVFILIFIAVGMAISLIATISPALKSSKLDIVSSLKYE
ncbi:MAG TPA: FtsX-like permease family protein [Clostridia bacterium]|nr:FtsX-like permease family protein [Clostridia bacterium]